MSIWYEAKEIDIDEEDSEFNVLYNTDDQGSWYVTITQEQFLKMQKDYENWLSSQEIPLATQ